MVLQRPADSPMDPKLVDYYKPNRPGRVAIVPQMIHCFPVRDAKDTNIGLK